MRKIVCGIVSYNRHPLIIKATLKLSCEPEHFPAFQVEPCTQDIVEVQIPLEFNLSHDLCLIVFSCNPKAAYDNRPLPLPQL